MSAMTTTARPALPLRRVAYAMLTVALLTLTVFEATKHGMWLPALFGLVAPDLAMLPGAGRDLAQGQLHPRAVPLYNAVHRFVGPVVLMAAASLDVLALGWFVGGLAWAAHVALDRTVGYGLRTREGFQRAR
jgi:hypothetical protein